MMLHLLLYQYLVQVPVLCSELHQPNSYMAFFLEFIDTEVPERPEIK